jgi:hypothetical protein
VSNITLPRAEVEKVRQALEVASMRFFLLASYSDVSVNGVKPSTGHAEATAALAALDAALAEPEKKRAETGIPARSVGFGSGETDPSRGEAYREHITDGSPCWCNPELNYRDPETGAELWIHRREQ